ncbi:glycerol-3-phosphate 1-O-acyltransferase PlsY [Tissierella carlieri]|uniref:Glycerol-3-phosphate acyltransferase n=1 Tax=Tissierella carlieri TaxID=689904 RepID=A0ABT1S5Z2_9FIRM|nr:glycerol-3-phosphate 1-O-acyltransferase PlsY [Tissierella carlieri]MBU5314140.1 glycerol-3-phosphate 1-O-acyltransferase PlsY [Tissierella carlieri]MCQ4921879.1 glycerol-3-phosphate 1-O-acyltransferase PlsY [Tissierella carlieri]
MRILITILLSYLIGCFSSAYFLGKISKNIDIRNYGSGNAGATNALRVLGKKVGALTFALDILKGVIAVLIGKYMFGFNGSLLAGIFVVLGHDFPIFLGFKGGKGVATSFGVLLILNWKAGLICLLVAASIIIFTKYVSLGSIAASISAPVAMVLTLDSVNKYLYITTWVLAALSVYRHKANILRLCRGEENKLGNNI